MKKPVRAFMFSFAAGLVCLFSGHAALSAMMTPQPDVQLGPINIPTA